MIHHPPAFNTGDLHQLRLLLRHRQRRRRQEADRPAPPDALLRDPRRLLRQGPPKAAAADLDYKLVRRGRLGSAWSAPTTVHCAAYCCGLRLPPRPTASLSARDTWELQLHPIRSPPCAWPSADGTPECCADADCDIGEVSASAGACWPHLRRRAKTSAGSETSPRSPHQAAAAILAQVRVRASGRPAGGLRPQVSGSGSRLGLRLWKRQRLGPLGAAAAQALEAGSGSGLWKRQRNA